MAISSRTSGPHPAPVLVFCPNRRQSKDEAQSHYGDPVMRLGD